MHSGELKHQEELQLLAFKQQIDAAMMYSSLLYVSMFHNALQKLLAAKVWLNFENFQIGNRQ